MTASLQEIKKPKYYMYVYACAFVYKGFTGHCALLLLDIVENFFPSCSYP